MEDNKNKGNSKKNNRGNRENQENQKRRQINQNPQEREFTPKNRYPQKQQRIVYKSNSRILPAKKRKKEKIKAKRNLVTGEIDIPIPKKSLNYNHPENHQNEKPNEKVNEKLNNVNNNYNPNLKQRTVSIPNPLYNNKDKQPHNTQKSSQGKTQTEPEQNAPTQNKPRKKKKSMASRYAMFLLLVAVITLCTVVYAILRPKHIKIVDSRATKTSQTTKKENSKKPTNVVATAKVLSSGNVIIENSILDSALQSDGTYNFDRNFENIKSLVKNADMAVCNFETTFGGTDKKYTGYKLFNSPDSVADALKTSGYDVVLTANEHSYDSDEKGMIRTANILKDRGLKYTGTKINEKDKPYLVTDVNGIKIGVIDYTYETLPLNGKKSLNGRHLTASAGKLVNSFNYNDLDAFYADAKAKISDMKKDGAQAIMFYVNWGDEYKTEPNSYQKAIAKKMCELDVDVLIGSHPHVIQSVQTLENNGHKMVCLYSMGNLISNQTKRTTNVKTGKTEDGMLFNTTFKKYSNGEVKLAKIECVPTWVNVKTQNGKQLNQIIPLEDVEKGTNTFGMSKETVEKAKESYKRTMAVVERGIESFNSSQKTELA